MVLDFLSQLIGESAPTREITSDLAIPPGEFLQEVLDEFGIITDDPEIQSVLAGKPIGTFRSAQKIECLTGVPAHLWLRLSHEFVMTMLYKGGTKGDSND